MSSKVMHLQGEEEEEEVQTSAPSENQMDELPALH